MPIQQSAHSWTFKESSSYCLLLSFLVVFSLSNNLTVNIFNLEFNYRPFMWHVFAGAVISMQPLSSDIILSLNSAFLSQEFSISYIDSVYILGVQASDKCSWHAILSLFLKTSVLWKTDLLDNCISVSINFDWSWCPPHSWSSQNHHWFCSAFLPAFEAWPSAQVVESEAARNAGLPSCSKNLPLLLPFQLLSSRGWWNKLWPMNFHF